MPAPYYYDEINQIESQIVPGTMSPAASALSMYFRRYLAQRAFSMFDFKGAPDTWDLEYLKFVLMTYGVAAVLRTDRFGVIPQQCGFSGYNVFYRPTRALVVNPLFDKTYELQIGEECELIRMSPDWRGIADLIGHHADLMALTVTSIITNLYNTRLSYVFAAKSKAMAESFKAMYDKVGDGNPAVFIAKDLMNEDGSPNWQPFQQDIKATFIVDLLQGAERTILNQFYNDIGVPNIPYEKNERLTTAEATTNDYATFCLADLWKRTINATLDKVNKMFGLNVSVDYNAKLLEVIRNGDFRDSDNGGTVQLQD